MVLIKKVKMVLTKIEFSLLFLASIEGYMPKVSKALIADVKSDLASFGLEATVDKWASFIGLRYNGKGCNWIRYPDLEELGVKASMKKIRLWRFLSKLTCEGEFNCLIWGGLKYE